MDRRQRIWIFFFSLACGCMSVHVHVPVAAVASRVFTIGGLDFKQEPSSRELRILKSVYSVFVFTLKTFKFALGQRSTISGSFQGT